MDVYVRIETEDNFRNGRRNDNPQSLKPPCRNDDIWFADIVKPGDDDWRANGYFRVLCTTRDEVERVVQACDRNADGEGFFIRRVVWDRMPFTAAQLLLIQEPFAGPMQVIPRMTFNQFYASTLPQNSARLEGILGAARDELNVEKAAALAAAAAEPEGERKQAHLRDADKADGISRAREEQRKRFAMRITREETGVPRRVRVVDN